MDYLSKLNRLIDRLDQSLRVDMVTIGITIPVLNRPDYVERCFESLKHSNLHNAVIVIVDDNSDKETKHLIANFELPIPIHRIYKTSDRGMFTSFVLGFDYICNHYPNVQQLITLDSDTIHHPDWLDKILTLYRSQSKDALVTGYNSTLHDIIKDHGHYCIKKSCGGINMLFSKTLYTRSIREAFIEKQNLWDWEVVKICDTGKIPILCTLPSCIQHIGLNGLHSNSNDVARDFDPKKI